MDVGFLIGILSPNIKGGVTKAMQSIPKMMIDWEECWFFSSVDLPPRINQGDRE